MRTTLRNLNTTAIVLLLMVVTQGEGSFIKRFQNAGQEYGFQMPPARPEGEEPIKEHWFEQLLDHFNPSDDRTWKQKYFMNDEFYKEGGPVFLMIGGIGLISGYRTQYGPWHDYAKRLDALIFEVEHRFYGDSKPTKDISIENLVYLSSEQALADLATFTVSMQKEMNLTDNKWVAFGGFYAGSLATWYRLKYPHLVHAAVTSSAPIDARVDFKEYMEVLSGSLATVGEDCNKAIKEANGKLVTMLEDPANWDTISNRFKLCSSLNASIEGDVSNLFSRLAVPFIAAVQGNGQVLSYGIDTVSDIMMNETIGDPLDRYVKVNLQFLYNFGGGICLEHRYEVMVKQLQQTSWFYNAVGDRSWIYQTCAEFGWYITSDSPNQPFANKFPVDFFIDRCTDVYGTNFTSDHIYEGAERTNAMYGGLQPKVTRVVFPNGSLDPWQAVGVDEDLNTDAPAVYINGTSRCADMNTPSNTDPPALQEAREEIFKYLQEFLKED